MQNKLALSVDELSTALGVHRATIFRQLADGTFPIPKRRLGRRIFFSRADVDAWLSSDTNQEEKRRGRPRKVAGGVAEFIGDKQGARNG